MPVSFQSFCQPSSFSKLPERGHRIHSYHRLLLQAAQSSCRSTSHSLNKVSSLKTTRAKYFCVVKNLWSRVRLKGEGRNSDSPSGWSQWETQRWSAGCEESRDTQIRVIYDTECLQGILNQASLPLFSVVLQCICAHRINTSSAVISWTHHVCSPYYRNQRDSSQVTNSLWTGEYGCSVSQHLTQSEFLQILYDNRIKCMNLP